MPPTPLTNCNLISAIRIGEAFGTYGTDERIGTLLITAGLPPHATAKTLLGDELGLGLDDGWGVVADHEALRGIVGPGCGNGVVGEYLGAGLRKRLVVVDAGLPGTLADSGEGRPGACSVGEGAAIEGHAHDDLGGGDAGGNVVVDGPLCVEVSAVGVAGREVPVGVVAGDRVPRARVVISPAGM